MKLAFRLAFCAILLRGCLPAAVLSADSARGSQVFSAQGCVACHALNGVGPNTGPDLGRLAARGFTPAALAATMWNHAPAMWSAVEERQLRHAAMDEQQAADLFAFFYSLRFFEEPGDASRGKALFATRQCANCHGIREARVPGAKPVQDWSAAANQFDLIETMWNHSTAMRSEMSRRGIKLPRLSGQDLADLLVYVRHVPGHTPTAAVFRLDSGEEGQRLFESKGCAGCHSPATRFLSRGQSGRTLTGIAADMWNHGLDMRLENDALAPGQMREIAGYIWTRRSLANGGTANRGAKVFGLKKCAVCHDDAASGAPPLIAAGRAFSGAEMVSVLTRHGPAMLAGMRAKNLSWPRFSTGDMSDLIAYLNTRNARHAR